MAIKAWKQQPDYDILLPQLEAWFDTEPGQSLLAMEQALVEKHLGNTFGYFLLQMGISRRLSLADNCRIQTTLSCHPLAAAAAPEPARQTPSAIKATRAEFDQLPIASDSVDAVILHHAQEFVANPHAVLREMQRVIVPQGRLLIIGFNPYSLLGIYGRLARFHSTSLWQNHLLSANRLVDWLSLLGFNVQTVDYCFHRPPIKQHHWFEKLSPKILQPWYSRMPFGSCYAISAVRQKAGMTPDKFRWQLPAPRLKSLVPSASPPVPSPSRQAARSKHLDKKSLH